ncbi:molecular chaperone HtpG [Melioribacter sp. Ez-97]|uniref:molecular chaperone HtpG n=1 Tax=Melioribacter sp. Ez-97 TaxID=3423434 RepID=UPI003ED9BCEF
MGEVHTAKKYKFKAEVKKLLDILVHSLYTSREIFLRELISNASDALDKLRFETTRGSEIINPELPLEIRITINKDDKSITVSDTGIGMNYDEITKNLGTIAKSGTEEFLKMVADSKDATNIIGRFGIGFYSVFMVAKEVIVTSRSYRKEDQPVEWRSDGLGQYEVTALEKELPRGTSIKVFLKDDAEEFLEKWRLESIIKKHSNFISFPIYVENDKINTVSAIWKEPKSAITKEQYEEFYKFLTHDAEPPADIIHKTIDAPIQFNALLFIPKKSDEFFWLDRDNYGLDLYVRKVLIQHKNKDLLPEYLGFVKGVVDSEDLPLNISRETLQENVIFNKIASSVTSTVLSYLAEKAKNDKEGYENFWKEHGKIFKLGYVDFGNREKYIELLRFNSSLCKDADEVISLEDYVGRMKENQKEIYYASGPNCEAILSNPHIEIFKNKGIEVLCLYEPVDELVVNSIGKYKDFLLKSIENADAKALENIKNDEKQSEEKKEELSKDDKKHFSSLLAKMKKILGDKVEDVVESQRLVESPACLVSTNDGLTSTMEKILRMTNKEMQPSKKRLEINPNNKLIRNLLEVFKKDSNDKVIREVTEQLYYISLLNDGELTDPHYFTSLANKYLEESSSWYIDYSTKGNNE